MADDAANSDTSAAIDTALDIPDDDSYEFALEAYATTADLKPQPPPFNSSHPTPLAPTNTHNNSDRSARLPNKLRQCVGKLQLQLAARNPLPPLCRALQASHVSLEHDALTPKLSPTFWVRSPLNAPVMAYDVPPLELKQLRSRDDCVIAMLSMPIQRAFRQNVLQLLVLVQCSVAVSVSVGIVLLPFDVWRHQLAVVASWLPFGLVGACSALYGLTLGLLYHVRHDVPINRIVLTLVLCVEVCGALLAWLLGNVYAIVAGSVLFSATMTGMWLLSTWRWKASRVANDAFTLLHPVLAAALSTVGTTVISCALYSSSVLPALSRATILPSTFAGVLAGIAVVALWTGLSLHCMSASLTPDEYARCVVFYYSDAFVACCMVPWRAIVKALRRRAAVLTALSQSCKSGVTIWSETELEDDARSPPRDCSGEDGGGDDDDLESQHLEQRRSPEGLTSPSRRRNSVADVVRPSSGCNEGIDG